MGTFHVKQSSEQRRLRGTAAYKRLRKNHIIANPLCELCKLKGKVVAAAHVDHITPASEDLDMFWDPDNLQSLCVPCHEAKTARENRRSCLGGEEMDQLLRDLYG